MKLLNGIELLKKTYNKLLIDVVKEYDLTLMELKILMFLEKNESNIAKDIVAGISATKSHVSMALCDLEQKKYIEKTKNQTDKKKNCLQLTEKSFAIIKSGKEVQKKAKQIMLDGINKEEIEMLNSIAKKIKNNLENYNKNNQLHNDK